MTRRVAIVQARLRSQRLPGKVLYELAGRPMILLTIERVRRSDMIDDVVLATGEGAENDALADIATGLGVQVYRGPEDDVLARYAGAAMACDAEIVVRVTGDCPLVDPDVIGMVLERRESDGLDYCTNVHPPSWPDGLDCSAFTRDTLERAAREAKLPSEREHVVPWMWANSNLEGGSVLAAANVPCPSELSDQRWTVDTADDYLMMRALADELGPEAMLTCGWREIADTLKAHPEIRAMNAAEQRDAGLAESRRSDAQAAQDRESVRD